MSPRRPSVAAVAGPPGGTPPRYAPSLDWRAYLYGVLEFDVGKPVRLFGAIGGSPSGLSFQIADSLGFDPRLFPAGGATTSVF